MSKLAKSSDTPSLGHIATSEIEAELERRKEEIALRIAPTTKNPGKLKDWNLDLKAKVRRLPRGFDIKKALGFDAAYILPIMQSYQENNQIMRRKVDVALPQARDMQITFRRSRVGPAGLFEEAPEKIVLEIMPVSGLPPDTTRGKHITAGYNSEDALRAIFADPNWCVCYYIFEMSDAEVEAVSKLLDSDEYQQAAAQRGANMKKGAEESAVAGILDRSM